MRLGTFWSWDVLQLGRFEAWTLCLWTFCIWDVLQLGRYVFGRFVDAPIFLLAVNDLLIYSG